jgi:hypothetical protein
LSKYSVTFRSHKTEGMGSIQYTSGGQKKKK